MKALKLKQDSNYKITQFKDSTWTRVEHNKDMIGLCMDLITAFEVIYKHINNNGGQCDFLSIDDFKRCR